MKTFTTKLSAMLLLGGLIASCSASARIEPEPIGVQTKQKKADDTRGSRSSHQDGETEESFLKEYAR